jgi:hypothetical protein
MLVDISDIRPEERSLWEAAVARAAASPPEFRRRLEDPDLQRFFDYWRTLYRDHGAAKSKFEPLDIPLLLGHVQIFELQDDGCYRLRLSGTFANGMIRRDITGQALEEFINPEHVALRYFIFDRVRERRLPIFYTDPVRVEHLNIFWSRRLLTPLYDAHGDCRYLYSIVKPYANAGAHLRDRNGLIAEIVAAGPEDV